MDRLTSQLMLRCSTADRQELKTLSEKFSISESNLARIAFRQGLKLVVARGIQLDDAPKKQARKERGT